MKNLKRHSSSRPAVGAATLLLSSLLCWNVTPAAYADDMSADNERDTCTECHSNPDFLVTNKNLYEYYRQWKGSVHELDDVTCSDCHGGNRFAADKDEAHSNEVGDGSSADSTVNFRRVPETCGQCHDNIYDAFLKSDHHERLLEHEQGKQGPSCVTCHGSLNASILSISTVEDTCNNCHNEETENNVEVPKHARDVLTLFQSIQRYYRYIGARGEPKATRKFFRETDKRLRALTELWHTFDMEKIEAETKAVVALLKAKRVEIAERRAAEPDEPDEPAEPAKSAEADDVE